MKLNAEEKRLMCFALAFFKANLEDSEVAEMYVEQEPRGIINPLEEISDDAIDKLISKIETAD